MILVSSWLLGNNVKYSGGNNLNELLAEYSRYLTPVCPEVLGGLMTPRQPAEIQGGDVQSVLAGQAKVMDKAGADVTSAFVKGAEAVLELVKDHKVRVAILKANSPSCGNKVIYDVSFCGKMVSGDGVTAALLAAHGVKVYSEEDINEDLLQRIIAMYM